MTGASIGSRWCSDSRPGRESRGRSLSIRYAESAFAQECKASRIFGGLLTHHQGANDGGGDIPNDSDVHRQQEYVKVLREVTAGDTLGPPEQHRSDQAVRSFELSGKRFAVALIDRMIAASLLDRDGERGVVETDEGRRFFNQHR